MRKALLPLAVLLCASLTILAQNNVGIGITTPHSSARLDITATDKGILIPRVSLSATFLPFPISAPAEGLLVWNTNGLVSAAGTGFYFWDGSRWRSLISDRNGWTLRGNSATTANDFIGTTDDEAFAIKVNNTRAGFIDHQSRNLFLGYLAGSQITTGKNNTFIGDSAGFQSTVAEYNTFVGARCGLSTTGNALNNAFFGGATGEFNVGGSQNSFFGRSAGRFQITGNENSYFGFLAGEEVEDGVENSYFGSRAGGTANNGTIRNSFFGSRSGGQGGANNSGLGDSAGYSMQSGAADNSFLGYRTTNQGISFNATAVGARARINCSNCMILGSVNGINGATSSVNVGIGLITPVRPLHISGTPTTTGITPHSDAIIVAEKSADNTYISILTDDDRASGITFGNHLNSIDGGIYYNLSGNSYDLRFRTNRNGTRMLIDSIGRVGIGTTTPDFQLELSQNSAAKPTSSLWTVPSDLRLKENVFAFSDGLSILNQINPVWFTYNGDAGLPKETGVGTIAQELKQIAPYMIKEWTRNNETYLGVDYGPLQFILINSIKEQQQMIEIQQNRLDSQQQKLDDQQKIIDQLLKRLETLEKVNK